MISGSMLILGAVGILALFIVFGFLLGFLRGFRKSLFFTIVFIVVVILSFIFATMLAKSVYSGTTLWKVAKGVLPDSVTEGSEGINSLKDFVRFYLEHNYTEVLENGMTAGQSMVANENAMAIIDGLVVMILKIFMLIGGYIVLSILFYILFGLIYVLFLRQKSYIETETTTDENGEEIVTEREVKPNKKRLSGGFIGAAKGFIKAMIILIPISFAIGMVAQIEVPKNSSSTSAEVRLAEGSSSDTLKDIVTACKQYDNSFGKIYLGLDDAIMDQIISYKVDGKKITLRKEVKGAINVYNTIELEIGIDNLKDYDFKNNLNSKEMKAIVLSVTENLSNSNATTTLLTAVGPEVIAILSDKADDKDADMALLFSEIDLKGKDSIWWKNQIAQLNTVYLEFVDMNLNFSAIDTKEYNKMFDNTKAEDFENFVDAMFDNELIEMVANGGLKYAVKKLPEGYSEVEEVTDQVVRDKKVNEEIKSFSKLIDIIREEIEFKDGTVDLDSLKLRALNRLVDTEILLNSKITGKIVESLLKNTITDIAYNGETINFDKSIFARPEFSIHNELKSLVDVLTDGLTENYSIGNLKDLEGTSKVGQICDMLESDGLETSLLANELFSKLLPLVLKTVTPDETYNDVTWPDEYKSISGVLENIYGREERLSNLTSLNFETLTFRKLDNLADSQKVWNGKVVPKILNSVALPYIRGLVVNQELVDQDYNQNDFSWKKELKNIVNLGLWASDIDGDISNDYDKTVNALDGSLTDELSDGLLRSLPNNVPNSYILQDILADSLISNNLIGRESEITNWQLEMEGLTNVAVTMEDDETHKLNLNTLNNITEVYKETVVQLKTNTHKSVILMNTMAKTLAEPMRTPEMKDENDRSAWISSKWEFEMPRIGDVLLTFAGDAENAKIVVSELDMDENSDIKFETVKAIETHIAYSEALENMFAHTLEEALKEEEDPLNPPIDTFPNPPEFDDELAYSAWWDAEITGLANVIYKEMGDETTIKLSEFNDTETVKVKVVKSLYADALFTYVEDGVELQRLKIKVYSDTFSQQTNIGVSEYLQYLFKPQLRDVSRRSTVETDPLYDVYYDFTPTYRWDVEIEPIMNMFLITRMNYNTTTEELEHLTDETEIKFGDISFGLYDIGSEVERDGVIVSMTGKEAAARNKERMTGMKNNVDDISYLKFILAPEMNRLMNTEYMVSGHTPDDWTNDDWIRETIALEAVALKLMDDTNPKMKDLDFYEISDEKIDAICENTAKSYLLQSKMAKSLVNAGINSDAITSVDSLTGEKDLMTYILEYDWEDGKNKAYEAIVNTLDEKRYELRDMKDATYDLDLVNNTCTFVNGALEPIVTIDGNTGLISANGTDPFLTDSVEGKINAVKTYAEYSMMYKSLKDNSESHPTDVTLAAMVNKVAERGSSFVYEG